MPLKWLGILLFLFPWSSIDSFPAERDYNTVFWGSEYTIFQPDVFPVLGESSNKHAPSVLFPHVSSLKTFLSFSFLLFFVFDLLPGVSCNFFPTLLRRMHVCFAYLHTSPLRPWLASSWRSHCRSQTERSLDAAVLSASWAVVRSDISSICASLVFSSSWKSVANQTSQSLRVNVQSSWGL